MTTVQFGIDHPFPAGQGYFTRYAACGPSPLELPDTGWPESGYGNLVAYGSPVYDKVFKFYWFAVDHDDATSYFSTRTYPSTNEAKFVDDGNPPVEDLCTNFGTIGWDGVAGVNHCPTLANGACCFADGHCSLLSSADCAAQGGTYQGDLTLCDPNPCPQPMGACCAVDGGCSVISAADCATQGGAYQGDGTTCDPNPCPIPTGACCFADGHCTALTQAQCSTQGGSFLGANTVCEPNPCPQPTGACCFHDGHCSLRTAADCAAQGGTWQGMNTVCNPNPCPQPTGACCYYDGSCQVKTEGNLQRAFGRAWTPSATRTRVRSR